MEAKTSSINFRAAEAKDIHRIVEFQLAMALETEDLRLDSATCQRGVEAIFENPLLGRYFIAEKFDHVAGCLLITQEWSDWRNSAVWWIQSVYVRPELRRQKIFSSLYRHVQQLAMADSKVAGLRLYVEQHNTRAQGVYEKLGMKSDRYNVCEWMKNF